MSKPDGGPVFPHSVGCYMPSGMSLRDLLAALAMQGMLSCQDFMNDMIKADKLPSRDATHAHLAALAYKQADAMIAARGQ